MKSKIKTALLFPANLLILRKLKRKIQQENGDLNVIIGSHNTSYPSWFPTNIDQLNLLKAESFENLFGSKKANRFLAEHVFEHLDFKQGLDALKNCYTFLQDGGHIRIAVPDGFHPNPEYINMVKPGGYGEGSEDHKVLYNYLKLAELMEESGFRACPLEYYDESGTFHFKDWSSNDGHILRSKRYDKRFNESIGYSSLIVDGIK